VASTNVLTDTYRAGTSPIGVSIASYSYKLYSVPRRRFFLVDKRHDEYFCSRLAAAALHTRQKCMQASIQNTCSVCTTTIQVPVENPYSNHTSTEFFTSLSAGRMQLELRRIMHGARTEGRSSAVNTRWAGLASRQGAS
jgi:hypothetical protein